jgi:hypothetical protein
MPSSRPATCTSRHLLVQGAENLPSSLNYQPHRNSRRLPTEGLSVQLGNETLLWKPSNNFFRSTLRLPHAESRLAQVDADLHFPFTCIVIGHRIETLIKVWQ